MPENSECNGCLEGARIAIVGDIRRNGFDLASRLRCAGINVDVFGRESDLKYLGGDPRPSWYHTYANVSGNPLNLISLFADLRGIRHDYDIVHARGGGVLLAPHIGLPYVAQSVGSDIREGIKGLGIRHRMLRRGFANSRRLLVSQIDHLELVPRHWPSKIYLPFLVSTEFMRPALGSPMSGRTLTIFHPSRHHWDLAKGPNKGNDHLIRALARFHQSGNDFRLILLKRGPSWQSSLELIQSAGLGPHTEVLDELDQDGLRRIYQNVDIVADQFGGIGTPGICALDGMACGCTVICCTNIELCARVYGSPPPLLPASNEEEIFEALVKSKNEGFRQATGERAREWILQNHSWSAVSQNLLGAYKAALKPPC